MEPPRRRILVLDDDPVIRMVIARILEEFEIIQAGRICSARAILTQDVEFAAVLCDVQLPDGCGIDFAREAQRTFGLPILIISGAVPSKNADDLPFLAKPFGSQQLRTAVGEMIRKHVLM